MQRQFCVAALPPVTLKKAGFGAQRPSGSTVKNSRAPADNFRVFTAVSLRLGATWLIWSVMVAGSNSNAALVGHQTIVTRSIAKPMDSCEPLWFRKAPVLMYKGS